jgi:hypothetical protein
MSIVVLKVQIVWIVYLHPETDPEERLLVRTREVDSLDLALHTTCAEATRDEDAVCRLQHLPRVVVLSLVFGGFRFNKIVSHYPLHHELTLFRTKCAREELTSAGGWGVDEMLLQLVLFLDTLPPNGSCC